MKNIYIFRKSICLFLILSFVMNVGWGQTISLNTTSSTLGGITSYTTVETSKTTGGYTYSLNNWIGNASNIQVRGNQSGATSNFYILNTTVIPGNITGISITGTNIINSKINLIVGTSSISSSSGGTAGGVSSTVGTSANWVVTGNNKYFRIQFTNGATFGTATLTNISITYSTPTITGSASTSTFTTTKGIVSTAQTFTVSGSNLTADLSATAPTGFEVSSNGITYGSTATFTQTSGSASGTLYIRLSSSASVGTYNSQNIVLSSTGATSVNITTPSTGNEVICSNPSAPTAGNASRCGSGTVTISATPSSGETIDWYSASTGGTSLSTGTANYTTLSISSNTVYYAEARNTTTGCVSSTRTNVTATVNSNPSISISSSPSNAIACTGSNVSLTATGASTYSWSGGISNGTSFSPTATTTYTVTGTDANGCSATASRTVNYYPASSSVVLSSSSVSGAVEQCTESDGYTYYADLASPGQYLFGIYKNGNSFTATVDITVDNVNKYKKNSSSNGANQEHASYIMSRYWNVNATGSIGTGVKVRFFVDPQDIIDLQNARDNDYNTLKNTTNLGTLAVISGTEYFKTVGTTYSPTNWIGNKYTGTIVKLTEDAVNTLNGQTYVELSGITSFSGGGIGAAFGPSSNGLFNSGGTVGLPVTWKEVNATVKEEGNWIQWITSSEKNTKHFEVEYSYDAKNFFKASNDIKAAVNSTTDKSYDFVHLEEYGELVYYRIKQVDLDGKVDYSKIVNVKRTSKLPEFHVSMYPVPLNEQELNLKTQTVQKTDITITINDLLGRGVYTESFSPQGYTTDHKLSLGHLQNGTYHVTIDNGMHKSVQVLVVGK